MRSLAQKSDGASRVKQEADELIKALEELLAAAPDGATLRRILGGTVDDAPMSPETFIAFTEDLLDVVRNIRRECE